MTLTPCLSSVPQNNEKLQESPCIFALTPRQVELIRNSRCAVGGRGRAWSGRPGAFGQIQRRPCSWQRCSHPTRVGPCTQSAHAPLLICSPARRAIVPIYQGLPLTTTNGRSASFPGAPPGPRSLNARAPPVVTITDVPRRGQCPLEPSPPGEDTGLSPGPRLCSLKLSVFSWDGDYRRAATRWALSTCQALTYQPP